MKKLLFSIAALAAFGFAQAQEGTATSGFSKGDVFVSGAVGYSSEETVDLKTTEFQIVPRVGYFVSENFAIGAQLGYISREYPLSTEFGYVDVKNSGFQAGAFARYYSTPASAFSFFGQLSATYASVKTEVDGGEDFKTNGFEFGVAPGISYFVSDHIALETTFGMLGYSSVKPDVDGAESTDTFNLNLDLTNVTFGIIYKF